MYQIAQDQRWSMNALNRITSDPAVLGGQPHIRGTALTVRRIAESLVRHHSAALLLAEHPEVDPNDVREAAEFAATHLTPHA